MTENDILNSRLMPTPAVIERQPGHCRWAPGLTRVESCPDDRVRREADRILAGVLSRSVQGLDGADTRRSTKTPLHLAESPARIAHSQGYELRVAPDRVELIGGSAEGCFLGLQTLRQLLGLFPDAAPCCVIRDQPAFALRGLLHDVTRGKVPTVETLKRLIDRLSALKVNQLQLYIEHAFTFAFDPDICDAEHGLTPDEIREVEAYAHERFITLVPAVATMGHVGRVLSMPKYRHLAEIEATKTWAQMNWSERARGFTLDVLNSESMFLVERIWGDVLDAFSGPVVNICGDEPHDLGRGRNTATLDAAGRAQAYIRRIADTARFVQSRGRQAQMWSDVLVNHLGSEPRASARAITKAGEDAPASPQPPVLSRAPRRDSSLFDTLPGGLAILHWGYDAGTRYDMTQRFVDAGFETVVCPGTTGWKRILNAIDRAERNLVDFARAGLAAGTVGLLNTDWGDHGHFNALGCSMHGIALGASCAWSGTRESGGAAFDRRFARWVLGTENAEVVALLRRTAAVADHCETWTLLRTPTEALAETVNLPEATTWRRLADDAAELVRALDDARAARDGSGAAGLPGPDDAADLRLAARFSRVLAHRVLAARYGDVPGVRDPEDAAEVARAYAEHWRACNKSGGLDDVVEALSAAGIWD
ncbi:MAG: hypothetical protein BroJett003_16840 [Planctomycetota bacterium]|nr:MAG: hypothetical protein BroJett003_16840 [Planctomycetota bacterium]